MRVSELVPAPRNPKAHDDDLIGASIGRFGMVEGLVLDERTQRLVAGHGRRDELMRREAADETPPEGVLKDREGFWLVPVQRGWASRSDEEAEGYLIASNRVGERGGWEPMPLASMLEELAASAGGLDGIGYSNGEILQMQADLGELARRDGSFLDGLAGDGSGRNPMDGSDGIAAFGIVEFRLPMDAEQRNEAMARLRAHQATLGSPTMADALREVLRTWQKPKK